jgi:hypothetical protein
MPASAEVADDPAVKRQAEAQAEAIELAKRRRFGIGQAAYDPDDRVRPRGTALQDIEPMAV